MITVGISVNDRSLADIENASEEAKKQTLQTAGSYLLRRTRQHYRDEKDPEGTPWPKTRFVAEGVRHVRTLYNRGDLFRSIETYNIDNDTVGVGTNIIYAKTHQEGAEFIASVKQSFWLWKNLFSQSEHEGSVFSWHYKIKIPARPFLGINNNDVLAITKIAESILAEKI